MDESMNCSDENHDLPNDVVEPLRRKRTILCSLRVVPVSSEHFLGRRYVMELTTTGLARELRVYRSLDELMRGVDDLGLHVEYGKVSVANCSKRAAAICWTSCSENQTEHQTYCGVAQRFASL